MYIHMYTTFSLVCEIIQNTERKVMRKRKIKPRTKTPLYTLQTCGGGSRLSREKSIEIIIQKGIRVSV